MPLEDLSSVESEASKIAEESNLDLRILPIKSVGVQGDFRSYAYPAVIWGNADWDKLEEVSTRLTNGIKLINRVVYLLAPEHLPMLKLKRAFLSVERLDLLRKIDALAMSSLELSGRIRDVSQMPTVMLPLSTNGKHEVVVLRPISTPDFMTARFTELPREFLNQLSKKILDMGGIDAVFFDVTHKPPGTVEWE